MKKQTQLTTSKTRKGDTSRTSSQGRKLASGGNINDKGDPEQDEATKSPKAGPAKPTKRPRGA